MSPSEASAVRRSAHRAIALLAWFGALVAAGLGLYALSATSHGLDRQLVDDAVNARSASLTVVAHGASLLGRSWLLIALAALLGVAVTRSLGSRAWAPLLAVTGAVLLQNVIKTLVDRPRPPVTHLEHVTGSSFPSGHATECTAFLLALLALVYAAGPGRWRAIATFAAAALICAVCASRVYLGVHYPTDVAAGIILGGSWAVGVVCWSTTGRRGGRFDDQDVC